MGYAMAFRGAYAYTDADQLSAALAQARELIDETYDEDSVLFRDIMRDEWERVLRRDGDKLTIDIDTYGPPFLYGSYESLIEVLAEAASSGSVDATMEGADEITSYPAGRVD